MRLQRSHVSPPVARHHHRVKGFINSRGTLRDNVHFLIVPYPVIGTFPYPFEGDHHALNVQSGIFWTELDVRISAEVYGDPLYLVRQVRR